MVTNRINYSVEPPTFHIPKYSSYTVTVTYSPSSIDEEETGKLKFLSPQLGEWLYLLSGSGHKPSVHPEDIIGAWPSPPPTLPGLVQNAVHVHVHVHMRSLVWSPPSLPSVRGCVPVCTLFSDRHRRRLHV